MPHVYMLEFLLCAATFTDVRHIAMSELEFFHWKCYTKLMSAFGDKSAAKEHQGGHVSSHQIRSYPCEMSFYKGWKSRKKHVVAETIKDPYGILKRRMHKLRGKTDDHQKT